LAGIVADTQHDENDVAIHAVPRPNNPNGFRSYRETYSYDEVGNFTAFKHEATSSPTAPTWTRSYTYVSGTNRLDTTSHSGGTKNHPRDVHGNITQMSQQGGGALRGERHHGQPDRAVVPLPARR